jgi:hypothetical protein
MAIRRFVVPVTCASDGSATAYTPYVSGKVISIRYLKTNFADTVDFTITADVTGEGIWTEENVTASATRHPRAATHSTAGVAALYASGGTGVLAPVALGRDRVKIVIANGGNATTGAFHVTVDG